MDVNNFENFSALECRDNLLRLGIVSHSDLIGKQVYYMKPAYGVHTVEKWDADKGEYLLSCDDHKFYSNPFRIHRCG